MKALLPQRSTKRVQDMGRSSLTALLAFAFLQSGVSMPIHAQDKVSAEAERFKDTEIRVIRPRYFNKGKRFELGGALNVIMNESFIYTYMATGIVAFHLNEDWAIEGSASYGLNIDREDKRILFDEFEIKTQLFRTKYQAELAIQYTPIYGKWQLPSGRLIYFDTYLTAGVGSAISSIERRRIVLRSRVTAFSITNSTPSARPSRLRLPANSSPAQLRMM